MDFLNKNLSVEDNIKIYYLSKAFIHRRPLTKSFPFRKTKLKIIKIKGYVWNILKWTFQITLFSVEGQYEFPSYPISYTYNGLQILEVEVVEVV